MHRNIRLKEIDKGIENATYTITVAVTAGRPIWFFKNFGTYNTDEVRANGVWTSERPFLLLT